MQNVENRNRLDIGYVLEMLKEKDRKLNRMKELLLTPYLLVGSQNEGNFCNFFLKKEVSNFCLVTLKTVAFYVNHQKIHDLNIALRLSSALDATMRTRASPDDKLGVYPRTCRAEQKIQMTN